MTAGTGRIGYKRGHAPAGSYARTKVGTVKVANRKQGYLAVYVGHDYPGHRFGWVHVHRYAMEQHLGRSLRTDEHVHHINGVKTDNRIENLQLVSPEDHAIVESAQRYMQPADQDLAIDIYRELRDILGRQPDVTFREMAYIANRLRGAA